MQLNTALFDDYVKFHNIQIANRDVDPVYPVLRRIAELEGWTQEERVRAVFLHVAYYDFGSALTAFERTRGEHHWFRCSESKLTCGTERRRNRMGDNLANHLKSLQTAEQGWGSLTAWLEQDHSGDPRMYWAETTAKLMSREGNGRWAAFKTCEMLAEVCGYPLEAPDMGHANSTGPRNGMDLLFPEARTLIGNKAEVIERLDELSVSLVDTLQQLGATASLATAETTLCDFHSLHAGRYYPGLDIDEMQKQLNRAPMSGDMLEVATMARTEVLPRAYLGELNDWTGVDTARKRVYHLTGEIIER